ncbi:MAG: hypothetical protein H7X71_08290, partial [Chitinophagales bacterium]|nr:hypothetical protein [Chitinophagales bacterium]
AYSDIPNREQTGGSYYGIMELTGNVMDRCVGMVLDTINPDTIICEILWHASFIGNNGDGELAGGFANVNSWPVSDGSEETSGVASRGGSFIKNYLRACTTERLGFCLGPEHPCTYTGGGSRFHNSGMRYVRTK